MSILEGELAETIAAALIDADIPYAITITRIVLTEPPNEWTPPQEVRTDFTGMGFIEAFEAEYIAGGLVQENDLKVVIMAPTLTITPVGRVHAGISGVS